MSRFTRRNVLRCGAALAFGSSLTSHLGSYAHSADDKYAGAELVDGEPPLPAKGAFSVVVLPDTQHYSEKHPDTFTAQTRWIAASRRDRNIAAVLHLGDITNHGTPQEWQNAVKSIAAIDEVVPYSLALGNHDYSEGGRCQDRTTRFNDHFSVGQYQGRGDFGGVYDKEPDRLENSYHLFSAEGRDFLVLSLEFGPRADVVRWANEIVSANPERGVILVTHAYMYYDDTRYDWQKHGKDQTWNPHSYGVAAATSDDVHDGEQLWRNLVSRHDNFILTLNGHVLNDGLARLTTATPTGREIPQVLVNFQMKPNGGDGWLRLLEFRDDGRTVEVFDYSPTLNLQNLSPQNRFSMRIPT